MVPCRASGRQRGGRRTRLHGCVQALADWGAHGAGSVGQSARVGSLACGYHGHGVCGRGVVWDESAGGYFTRGRDGGGKVWGFLSVMGKVGRDVEHSRGVC